MIQESEVFKIGKFIKPHGVKGEIALAFNNDIFDRVDCPYLICEIEGIFVPFFIAEYRFKGKEIALFIFEDIDSEQKAHRLTGLNVYFPRKYFEEDETQDDLNYSWNFFIGFKAIDQQYGELGYIEEVDEKTINTLFRAIKDDEEYIIPANEDFITSVDPKNKIVYLNLPQGLFDLL